MLYNSTRGFYNLQLVSNIGKINSVNIIGNICIIIAGNYRGNNNLDKFIEPARFYNINRFYSISIFGYNSGRERQID